MLRGYNSDKVYCYKADVVKVVNRSTIYLDVHLGFSLKMKNVRYKIATLNGYAYKNKHIDTKQKVLTYIRPGDELYIKTVTDKNKMYCDISTDYSDLKSSLYHYNSYVEYIVDGDTLDISIDLGFNLCTNQRFRLSDINCWEMRGENKHKGELAKNRVIELIPVGTNIITKTIKDEKGKYGRYLCEIYQLDTTKSINTILLDEGHAILY